MGIIGASACDQRLYRLAERVGELVGQKGWVLLCGGLGGVMEASAKGARKEGSLTVGILPGPDRTGANPWVDIPIVTDMGQARNVLIVRSADLLVAVSGGYGTLSEISLALKTEKPVIGLDTWPKMEKIRYVDTPEEALQAAADMLASLSDR